MNVLEATPSDAATLSLLAHADLTLLATNLLRQPEAIQLPEPDEIDELLNAAEADPPLRIALDEAVLAARQAMADPRRGDWGDEYHRLFEGAMACPPNESAFIRRDKGVILADIMGFYTAFGFVAAQSGGEKPDHLCCELEYVAALLVMRVCARQAGRGEHEQTTRQALASFAQSHLGVWLGSFVGRLSRVTVLPVYAAVGALLERLWNLLAQQHGWKFVDEHHHEPADEDSTPYECGMVDEPAATELTLRGQPLVRSEAD